MRTEIWKLIPRGEVTNQLQRVVDGDPMPKDVLYLSRSVDARETFQADCEKIAALPDLIEALKKLTHPDALLNLTIEEMRDVAREALMKAGIE